MVEEIVFKGKKLRISTEGITYIELNNILKNIEKDIKDIEEKNQLYDTIKQMSILLIKYSIDIYKIKKNSEIINSSNGEKINKLIEKLKENLSEEKLF